MQILYGFHSMDSGEIFIDCRKMQMGSPKDAIALGIGMVHQEFMLVRPFSVAENTMLGLRDGNGPLLDLQGIGKTAGVEQSPRARARSVRQGGVVAHRRAAAS